MKEKNLLTSFIDFIDERTSSVVPFKYLVAKTNARKISMLLLTIIMLSTFSPVAMSAQGLFSDALDNISSNSSSEVDYDEESSSIMDTASMSKTRQENLEMTEKEREELRKEHDEEVANQVWNQRANTLSEKELKKIGIVETEEEPDITVKYNFTVGGFLKLFEVVDRYGSFNNEEKTEELNSAFLEIQNSGYDKVLEGNKDIAAKLLSNDEYIRQTPKSVIKYNEKNYKVSDEYNVIGNFYYSAATVKKADLKAYKEQPNTRNTVTVVSVDILSDSYDSTQIPIFTLSNGDRAYCIERESITNSGAQFDSDQQSTYFQGWSEESQMVAVASGHVGASYTKAKYAQVLIWGAEDGATTVSEAVEIAKVHSTLSASGIENFGDEVEVFVGDNTYLVSEDCTMNGNSYTGSIPGFQDLLVWNCDFTFRYPKGDVIIEKTYEDEGYADYDRERSNILIRIKDSDGRNRGEATLNGSDQVHFSDLPVEKNPYTWEEVNTTDGWETVVGSGSFTVAEDTTTIVDHAAGGPVNHLRMGSLEVTKNMVNDTDVPTLDITGPEDVTIAVRDNEPDFDWIHNDEEVTLDNNWHASFTDMPFGEYTVEEIQYDEFHTKQIMATATVEIWDEAPVLLDISHHGTDGNYIENEIKWGNLKVEKNYINETGLDHVSEPSDVEITVESLDGYHLSPGSTSISQRLDRDWSTTFERLPWGTYYVTETDYDEVHTEQIIGEATITMSDDNPGDEGTRVLSVNEPDDNGDGWIENEVYWANVLFRKDIINETDIPTDEIVNHSDIAIHVTDVGEDFDYDETMLLDDNWEAFFEKLPVGNYYAEEILYGNTVNSLETIIGGVHFEVTAADDEQTIEISIDNPWDGDQFIQNRVRWANLYIEKNMVNDTATPTEELTSPEDVWIKVESVGESFTYYEEHQLDSNWSTTFEKMPVGHYHVEEYEWDQEHSKRIMWDTEIDVTPADDKLTLEMSKDNPWPGTDFYIENEILWANLLVTKNMINDTAVPVEDITSPDQVEITVESLDGYHIDGVHTSITKTLNNHWEALFPKLPVGHYRITETTWDETHTKQIQSFVEIEITPADDETIIYIDKDHPVGDAYIENEILWANVLITKNMINDTEIPTDDITSPSQVVITLESLDGYRLDGTNTSISGTLDSDWSILFPKIPVGHYKVTETVWDQTHTKQIMNEVTFEVKPEDDESIIYIDKDNPVGDAYIENEILWANVIFTKDVINLDDFSEDAIENIDKSQIKIHVQSVGETFSYDKTLSLDDDWSVMFEKLPVGHYHYTEELPNPSNMEVIIGEGDFEVTPADDETIIRIDKDNPGPDGNFIQNRLKEFTFRLTVRDSITEERLGAGYEFAVYDEEPEVEVVEGSDVFGDEGVLTDSDHDYITDEIPLFTMQTDREGEAVSPVLPFDTDGTQDLYIYETDVETDQYGNETYFLNDGGILLHAEADVSDGEEIQVEYFNLKKDYAQMRTNTSVVDTEGNSVEDFDLSGFEYTIFDKDENSENYGNIAESVAVDGIPAEEQILVSDADGKANSGVLHANLSLNSFNNKPADERMDYTVEPSGFPDGMTEEMFKQVPDPYDFSTNGLTKLFYYDAVYVIDDATLEIDKVDQDDNPLEDAEFTIYEDLDTNSDGTYITDTDKEVDTITSDENGIAKISLPRSADYYVQETEAPEGYDIDETVYKVEFNEEGKETIKVEDELISEKIRTDLILYNKDGSTGQIITEPATFELRYTYDGHEEVLTGTTTSGKIEFNDVPVVDTDGSEIIYTLQEVKAPGDYTIDNNEYQFELYFDNNGDIQYETVYSQATGKLETTTQDATAYTGTGTLEDIPEDVNDTTVDMDFYNYKEDSASDIVDEMPDTALGFFVK